MSTVFSKTLLIWSGSILGLSFIATPIKFHASGITMPVAIAVGKVTFHAMQQFEWVVYGSLLLHTTFVSKPTKHQKYLLGGLGAILSLQSFILLPMLDQRADLVITKQVSADGPQTHQHLYYVILEVLKLGMTAVGGWLLTNASTAQ